MGGFYGMAKDARRYSSQIQAGTAYSNHPTGASTGARLGYQFFGVWKGVGALGGGTSGPRFLLSYTREQSPRLVEPK
jgi:acyl-CoA reductase-like NAD-dependent aldehyde dehydrogenase